jgi:CRISPR-associated endonuclease Csn1
VNQKLSAVLVSHRPRRRLTGALHEETNYGRPRGRDGQQLKDAKGQPLYSKRKPLGQLTQSELNEIADPGIRARIEAHLKKHGVKLAAKGADKTEAWKKAMDLENPPLLPNRNGPPIPIRKVRLHGPSSGMEHISDEMGNFRRAVKRGSNHHIAIFEESDGKGGVRWVGEVVSTFEAARRARAKEQIVKKENRNGGRFIMSLAINDMVRVGRGDSTRYYRVQVIDGRSSQIRLRLMTAARIENDSTRLLKLPNALKELDCVKVNVDYLGRVRELHD